MKIRLDKLLVDKGVVSTRSKAKVIIEKGLVKVDETIIKKAGSSVEENSKIELLTDKLYVGRGAYKLEKALEEFQIEVANKVAIDFGASTGGFTQVLLDNGINKVYAIDVGHDQLDKTLLENPKVENREGANIRYMDELPEKADIGVVDLSYISIRLVMEKILANLKEGADLVVLIKPQFEAGKERIMKLL